MSITQTNMFAKIAAIVAGLGIVAMSFASFAVPAKAQTTTTTTTTTSAASVTFARNLTIGSTGADVTAWQTWLLGAGFSIPAGATGYFGTQTRAATAAYQASKGIVPAVGFFGPITRASITGGVTTSTVPGCAPGAAFSSTTGQSCGSSTTTTGGPLSGGEGSIDNFQILGSPSNVTVYQGQMAQVYGFQFLASGSDLSVGRVDFDLTNNGNVVNGGSGQDRPWAVFQTATLYDGSNVIGTVDASNASNWSQDGNLVNGHQTYAIRFDNMHDVVRNGSTANFYVAFTAQNGISTANQTQYQIQVASQGVRATDAMGLQQYSGSGGSTTFNVSNGTAGNVIFSTGSDNPQATTVVGNQTSSTKNVTLATFTVQSQNAATQIYSLPVTLNVATSTGTVIPVQDLNLVENGTVIKSVAVTSSNTFNGTTGNATTSVLFNNLTNLMIPAGSTQEFSIQADINPVGGGLSGNAADGSSASVTINPNATGADIEQGSNRVTPTGNVAGNVITFRSFGINATVTAGTPVISGQNSTSASFSFSVPVTAFNQSVYVASTSSAFSATIHTATTTYAAAGVISSNATTDTASGAYVVNPGSTQTFTITVTASGAVGTGLNYAVLNALKWGAAGNTSTANTFTFPSGSGNQSNAVNLNAS